MPSVEIQLSQHTFPAILIVDDEPHNYDVIENLLYRQGYELYYAGSARVALEQLQQIPFDLILMDVMMPEIDGLTLCRLIKQNEQWQGIPIVMVTVLNTTTALTQCLEAGADDFIGKPINAPELRARVQSMLRIRCQYRQIQQLNQHLAEKVKTRTHQLQQMIWYHPLTGLPSRFSLLQHLREVLTAGNPFALLYFDGDNFSSVNSCYGYEIGDRALNAISDRVNLCLTADAILAHLGEDDFCVLLPQVANQATVETIVHQIFDAFSSPFFLGEHEIDLSISMGVVYETAMEEKEAETILRRADAALNWAKTEGKSNYRQFQPEMQAATVKKLQLTKELRRALEKDEFEVYYQPIIDLKRNRISGFEALIRWHHPEQGLVSPATFIPCLEETGLIVGVGRLVLEKACRQLTSWQAQGFPHLTISVNLSALQLRHESIVSEIRSVLEASGLSPAQLKLELTESLIIDQPEETIELINKLRQWGIQFSLDDFGTGYSSLSYLQQFPVDNLKIDRAFVNLLESSQQKLEIIRAIVNLGQALGMSITVEGIETASQLKQLQQLDCKYGQGYHFAKPMNVQEASTYLFSATPPSLMGN